MAVTRGEIWFDNDTPLSFTVTDTDETAVTFHRANGASQNIAGGGRIIDLKVDGTSATNTTHLRLELDGKDTGIRFYFDRIGQAQDRLPSAIPIAARGVGGSPVRVMKLIAS